MGLDNFILTCEKDNKELRKDIEYYKNYNKRLQQENKQLKEKINTYENPEDLTLMFMYCDEKAKDKIKELKEEINKMSKKEIKVRDMLYSIENGTLTRERLMQIEEVLFEIGGEDNE